MPDSPEDMDEFLQIYLEESGEEAEQLVKLLLQLEEDPNDFETLREAFRLLHTFKGSSGMMGYERVNALAHELETRFDACRSGRELMTTEVVSVALRCIDYFRDFLTSLANGTEDQGDPGPLIDELTASAAVPADVADEDAVEDAATQESIVEESARDEESALEQTEDAAEEEESALVSEWGSEPDVTDTSDDEELRPAPEPIVSTTSSEAGPLREVTIGVRFSDRIELPDLKARLILARLQALGEVLGTEPPIDTLDQAQHPITLSIRVRSTSAEDVIVDSLDLEGVAAAYVAKPEAATDATEQESIPTATEVDEVEVEAEKSIPASPVESKQEPAATPTPARPAPRTPSRGGETIRVGIDRLDRLMNLAGELVVTNARFDQLADEMRLLFRSGGSIDAGSPLAESLLRALSRYHGNPDANDLQDAITANRGSGIIGNDGGSAEGAALRRGWIDRGRRVASQVSETVDQLARLSRNIQQAVLETRMIPVGPMFNRFRRTVRDIALKQGKQVVLELEGEMTELDKRMVDELGDPMIHLIRNALDHGIESTETRLKNGKPAQGLMRLRASHQSNHVVIEITDDGAGIDAEKVRARAFERGLATENELRMMTDPEVYGFIWHAGFSTADQVSDMSGRGVGMDVVRDRIAALGGVVELTSQPGVGSTVSIRLPLTLAIVNAMIVRFRGFRLAIPVTEVFEIQGLARSEIFESQGREMIDVRGRLLPLYRLDELFHWNDHLPPANNNRDSLVQAVLVRRGHQCLAIEVDDLDGNSDIVIKSLDEHFSQIPGLGGVCVMGDGEVCLVLDPASLGIRSNPRPGNDNALSRDADNGSREESI
jgi:two-component system chemotaxis sensor kinase CheA